jgi:hydrophobic/amphiphilic exporter-1 (mainly G- bacteria), HAE1 family
VLIFSGSGCSLKSDEKLIVSRISIERPTAVIAGLLMIVIFGIVALKTIPIQMTPDVRRPVIQIRTYWSGAAPAEVEREITNIIEKELTGIPGLFEISSRSQQGRSFVTMSFNVDQDMDKAFQVVSNRLISISDLPSDVRGPSMRTSGSEDRPIARIALRHLPGNTRNLETYGDIVNEQILDRLERVSGVSRVYIWGGSERELRIVIEPEIMALYGLGISQVMTALRGANASISAGSVDEGKRRYIVRTEAETTTIKRAMAVVLRTTVDAETGHIGRTTVGDIGTVEFGYKQPTSYRRFLGAPAITINVVRESGANVIKTMDDLKGVIDELNDEILPDHGLKLTHIYDETVYIESAIGLVKQNIWVGGALAALILLLFLRSPAATLIISTAIPVSVVGTFVVMAALGRSINVISLAGIAFAVGMVVDAAIVVLENIYRHRQEGKSAGEAALAGVTQVWGAILASVLTTVVVFIPLLTLNLQVGQLFRDIAVAISVSVVLSLLVSMTLIPTMGNKLLAGAGGAGPRWFRLPVIDELGRGFYRGILAALTVIIANRFVSMVVVLLICIGAGGATWLFLPKLDYLPDGNRNFVSGRVMPPPGYNLKTANEVAERIESQVRPLWASTTGSESDPGQPPKIQNFFFVALRDMTFFGASAVDGQRVSELVPILRKPIFSEPGTRGFVTQASLFGRAVGGSRSINLDISGGNLEELIDIATRADQLVKKALPRRQGTQVRPRPGLELGAPEIRIEPDQVRVSNAGLTARELGLTVDAYNDGVRVTEITIDGERMDLMIRGPERHVSETQGIGHFPVVTPSGQIVPVSSLAEINMTSGPTEIRHLNNSRAITLQIRPTKKMALEDAINILQTDVVEPLKKQGLPEATKVRLSGAADDLWVTWQAMKYSLLVAILIVYLVIAVLFESFVYPLIILLSVPIATAGGIGGLAILNAIELQTLDMLTMLGFVILVGIVVNNAILLVDQTLHFRRDQGLDVEHSIIAATKTRIRPIFMSTLTSIFGLMPLVLFPGAGSELYRGLGSVVIGGLALSAVLTLFIVPPLMSIMMPRKMASHPEPAAAE